MNALTFAASTSYPVTPYVPGLDDSQGLETDYPTLLIPTEQAEVEEALALSDLGVMCFNCCFGASSERSGQFWCSVRCWIDVMNGGCDYGYEDADENADAERKESGELSPLVSDIHRL